MLRDQGGTEGVLCSSIVTGLPKAPDSWCQGSEITPPHDCLILYFLPLSVSASSFPSDSSALELFIGHDTSYKVLYNQLSITWYMSITSVSCISYFLLSWDTTVNQSILKKGLFGLTGRDSPPWQQEPEAVHGTVSTVSGDNFRKNSTCPSFCSLFSSVSPLSIPHTLSKHLRYAGREANIWLSLHCPDLRNFLPHKSKESRHYKRFT